MRAGRNGQRAAWAAGAVLVLAATAGCGAMGGSTSSESATSAPAGGATIEVTKAAQESLAATTEAGIAGDRAQVATGGQANDAAAPMPAAAPGTPASPGGDGGAIPVNLTPIDLGRSIIFTASLNLEVDDVTVASDRAMQAIASVGGFVFGQRAVSEPLPSAVLTFKVPPKSFADAMAKLAGIGILQDQKVSSEDVTERVVDLQSRILSSEASVKRLRDLLTNAGDINTIAALEGQLLQRETMLEQLRGQLRTIETQVDLATIELTLTQPQPPGPAATVTVTYGSEAADLLCPATEQLDIVEGDRIQVCYEVHNTGSTTLTKLTLRDPGLGFDPAELEVVDGALDAPLAPGGRVLLGAETTAAFGSAARPQLRAQPVDGKGEPIAAALRVETVGNELGIAEDTALPGFGDSLATGGRALRTFVSAVLVLLGVLLPFAWVPALVAGGLWWRRRNRRRGTPTAPVIPSGPTGPTDTGTGATPPSPPTGPAAPADESLGAGRS